MFDFLKKKITGLVEKIAGKKEGPETGATAGLEKIAGKAGFGVGEVGKAAGKLPAAAGTKKEAETRKMQEEKPAAAEKLGFEPKVEIARPEQPKPIGAEEKKTALEETTAKIEIRKGETIAKEPFGREKPKEAKIEVAKSVEPEKNANAGETAPKTTKREEKVKLSLLTQVKSIFSNEVELGEKDVGAALDDFEMEMLEGDVAFEVAEQIKGELRRELIGKKVKKSELRKQISSIFFNAIRGIMAENAGRPVLEQVRGIASRPVKIMFTGPNGSGKTTTIAKVANLLRKNGFTVVIAAADTFRAAAIEQMEIHGTRLGVNVIRGKYGADPASVAFDAVNHAKAHNIDVVLIDTAGRQETNQNLLNELKKMVRVINPELKIYVGESIAGNAVIEQVNAFNRELKLDGVILTKLDCDAKGGTVISISKVTRVPVLYITTGQEYGDIEAFDAERIARNIAG